MSRRVPYGGVSCPLTSLPQAVTPTSHRTPRADHPEDSRRTARIRCLAFLSYVSVVYLTLCCNCARFGYQACIAWHTPGLYQAFYYLVLKASHLCFPLRGVCISCARFGHQACLACQTPVYYQFIYYWVLMTSNVCLPLRDVSIMCAMVLHIYMLSCVVLPLMRDPAFCMVMCRHIMINCIDTPSVIIYTVMWSCDNSCTCDYGLFCHILRCEFMAALLPANRCIPCCEAVFVFILTKFSSILQCARVCRRRSCAQDGSPPSGATPILLYSVITQRSRDSRHAPAHGLRYPFIPIPTCYLHIFGSPAVPSSVLRCASGSVPADGPRALVKDFLCYTNGLAHFVRINVFAFAIVSALIEQLMQHQVTLRRFPCILHAILCKAIISRCKAISCVCDYYARVLLMLTTAYATCKAMGS